MQLELGKRYVRKDGKTTAALSSTHDRVYPFWDELHEAAYAPNGKWDTLQSSSKFDLIEEFIEPKDEVAELKLQVANLEARLAVYEKPQLVKQTWQNIYNYAKAGFGYPSREELDKNVDKKFIRISVVRVDTYKNPDGSETVKVQLESI